ncbi:hypothetical protein [Hyphomicrobium sp. DY-1]|uniref:hypothetical protein n=1 Tax=Hyphomicrobium sp. DY-1 TaxID=3075650 RepID=UPI0039C3FB62
MMEAEKDVAVAEARNRSEIKRQRLMLVGPPEKPMERLSAAILGAMTAGRKYDVSYPMVGVVGGGVLSHRTSSLAREEFWVRDAKGRWQELLALFNNPMVKVRRCLKAGPGGQFLMEVREQAYWPAGDGELDFEANLGEAHRLVALQACMEDPFAVIDMVDDVVREALTAAYALHPHGAAFLAEVGTYYRWGAR